MELSRGNSNSELTGASTRLRKMLRLWFCLFLPEISQKSLKTALPDYQASYFPCLHWSIPNCNTQTCNFSTEN